MVFHDALHFLGMAGSVFCILGKKNVHFVAVILMDCHSHAETLVKLLPVMGVGGIFLLILGGVLYTAGGYVYTTEEPNP